MIGYCETLFFEENEGWISLDGLSGMLHFFASISYHLRIDF